MTSQLVGILLVVASIVMACLVSRTLERRHPGGTELRKAEARRGDGKAPEGERRRFPPLHY